MKKVVIDTNLLINGSKDDFNFGNRIVDEVIRGKIQAFANTLTLKENRYVAKKKIEDPNYWNKLQRYFAKINVVDTGNLKLSVVEDPEDNKLVESGVAAGAEYLISSDKHLLRLEKFNNLSIVSPDQFWNIYQEDSGESWRQWMNQFINNQ